MTFSQIKTGALFVLYGLLITTLFYKTTVVNPQEHRQFTTTLQQLKEQDALLNKYILKLRYQHVRNYDHLVSGIAKITQLKQNLAFTPQFLDTKAKTEIDAQIATYTEILTQQERMVESFKSANAILNNSITYLPTLISEQINISQNASDGVEQIVHLKALLKNALLYNLTPDETLKSTIQQQLADLEKNITPTSQLQDLPFLKAHIQTLLTYKPQVDRQIEELNALPTAHQNILLRATYNQYYTQAIHETMFYRDCLFVCIVFLLGYVVYIFARLKQTARALHLANETLEEKVAERTLDLQNTNLALETARDEAQAASIAKTQFLGTVSHEIRTPLNGIIGMTHLVRETSLDEHQKEYLDIVYQSGENLLTLFNNILDLSHIEAGNLQLKKSPFDLKDILTNTLKPQRMQAEKKGLELTCQIASEVPSKLIGDPERLGQIVGHLTDNAIKFTEKGHVELNVDFTTPTTNRVELHISVKDTGIGIGKDKQKQIFDVFTQADGSTTRQYEGLGLGLTLSSKLITLMGGNIDVDSELDTGSTFHFTVNFTKQDDIDPEALFQEAVT